MLTLFKKVNISVYGFKYLQIPTPGLLCVSGAFPILISELEQPYSGLMQSSLTCVFSVLQNWGQTPGIEGAPGSRPLLPSWFGGWWPGPKLCSHQQFQGAWITFPATLREPQPLSTETPSPSVPQQRTIRWRPTGWPVRQSQQTTEPSTSCCRQVDNMHTSESHVV